ncbi:M18 family aminopeptidase [Lachnobacterium bovis]|uniref:M18 family aminopeptidase n=1 Tax=Lachnobacterium bovis TaxID=140626 RepID=UPI0003B69768|nr:M18 family aminopeptidase [Lachnobacterium bovis]
MEFNNLEIDNLFSMVKMGVSPFGVIEESRKRLEKAGFCELSYGANWKLEKGKKYFVDHHGSTIFAFTVGKNFDKNQMIRMAAAHTDYPCFRIKPNPDFNKEGYGQINTESYGGLIINTWLDRPLSVAGKIALRSDNVFEPKIVNYRATKPILTIPNLAIHMNRDVNKGVELNKQIDTMPIVDLLSEEQRETKYFMEFLAEELKVDVEDILDFELSVFATEEPCFVGVKDTMISSPRLDNLTSASALLSAIINNDRKEGINLIALFDHEEIGSSTKQGAGSIMLHDMLRRILSNLDLNEEEIQADMYKAMMLSVDVAHGLHPNKAEKMDITNHPVLGKGFCIKEACSQSYATDAKAIAIVQQICEKNKIPYQRFVNRSDVRGGGTLGSIASTLLPIKVVDIGVPLLAMHSVRELMGTKDQEALYEFILAFFTEK